MTDPLLGRDREHVGLRLSLTRESMGYSQREFAEEAGLKATTYNQYETGTNMPNMAAAHALCDRYRLTLDWIFRGDTSGLRYETASAINALYKLRSR